MTVFTVHTTQEFNTAVAKAKDGDTISLAYGEYAPINMYNVNRDITITSADKNHPAVLTGLTINKSAGITLSDVEVKVPHDTGISNALNIYSSQDIVLKGLYVHGTLDGVATGDKGGIAIQNSNNVTVSGSEFQQLKTAITFFNTDGLTIENNFVHEMQNDGFVGGGSSHLAIRSNVITNFQHTGTGHPDGIQIYTTNTTTSAHDIVIDGNLITRGGGSAVQGIFMNEELGTMPYKDVSITNNTVTGMLWNGIFLKNAIGSLVEGNTVLAAKDQQSWIAVLNSVDTVLAENVATAFNVVNSQISRFGNVQAPALNPILTKMFDTLAAAGVSSDLLAAIAEIRDELSTLNVVDGPANPNTLLPSSPITTLPLPEKAFTGTAGADRMAAGETGDHRLVGNAGDDTFLGNAAGRTTMVGGAGDDTYVVKTATDIVVEKAGEGTDTVTAYLDYTLTEHVETLRMMAGATGTGNDLDNRIIGSAFDDKLYGLDGSDTISGGDGNDRIWGGNDADSLRGDAGNDTIWGGAGNDRLYGDDGDDQIFGDDGDDRIESGAGSDTMTGGAGRDQFIFRSSDFQVGGSAPTDTITDFSQGDKISLNMIDANVRTAADEAFKFIGSQAFHKVAGELRAQVVGRDTVVSGDVNGDGVADFHIKLLGVTTVTTADFVL